MLFSRCYWKTCKPSFALSSRQSILLYKSRYCRHTMLIV